VLYLVFVAAANAQPAAWLAARGRIGEWLARHAFALVAGSFVSAWIVRFALGFDVH
jgi:hypothetical protein